MKSRIFYFISLIITLLITVDVLAPVVETIGQPISFYRTYVDRSSMIGLSYGMQLGILGISIVFMVIGIVFSKIEEKELWA